MENNDESTTGVFQICGEPAIVINGVPPWNTTPLLSTPTTNTNTESQTTTGFGAWLVGREVKKQFGDQYYSGTVTEFDNKTGWYRAVYEDGDFEDLEWTELEDVLVPLDIMIPVKALAFKMIKRGQKKKIAARSKNRLTKKLGIKGMKGKAVHVPQEAPSLIIDSADRTVIEDVKNDEQH